MSLQRVDHFAGIFIRSRVRGRGKERRQGFDAGACSESEAERQAIEEIELYQAAESAMFAKNAGYVNRVGDWYLPWLVRLRLVERGWNEEFIGRSEVYLPKSSDQRRLAFMDALARVLPESREAPLVLFRLAPLSVQIATARAFGDRGEASKLRLEQTAILPAIADCRQCRAQVLECVEQCRACGNPLWKYQWLTAASWSVFLYHQVSAFRLASVLFGMPLT